MTYDQGELSEVFSYNPETGIVIRKKRTSNRVKVGDVAGCKNEIGYLVVRFSNRPLYLHRVIWVMIHGHIDEGLTVDHINGNRSDNRLENLRVVTQKDNCRNCVKSKNNTSGVNGVYFRKDTGKWNASIRLSIRKYILVIFA